MQRNERLNILMHLKAIKLVEMPGIEPGAFHMQSERSTTELHPRSCTKTDII